MGVLLWLCLSALVISIKLADGSELRKWIADVHKVQLNRRTCSVGAEAAHDRLCDEVLQMLFDIEVGADFRFSDGQVPPTALEFAMGIQDGIWAEGTEPFYPFYDMRDSEPAKKVCVALRSLPEYSVKCCSILSVLCTHQPQPEHSTTTTTETSTSSSTSATSSKKPESYTKEGTKAPSTTTPSSSRTQMNLEALLAALFGLEQQYKTAG